MARKQRGVVAAVSLAAGLIGAGGCSHPRIVTNTSVARGQMKILYQENKTFGRTEQGIIKCDVGGDGSLTNCRRMALKLED